MAKEHSEKEVPYFKTYNFPGSADKFILSCEESCKKVLGDNYRKWITCNAIENHIRNHWDDVTTRTYWAMALIREYSFTIWNTVFKNIQKDKGEHSAHKAADEAFDSYLKKFK